MTINQARRLRKRLWAEQSGFCVYCDGSMQPVSCAPPNDRTITRDHIKPLALGGRDTADNQVAACQRCNGIKGSMTPDDMRAKAWALDDEAQHLWQIADRVDALLAERAGQIERRVG